MYNLKPATIFCSATCLVLLSLCQSAQCQTNLEDRIKKIFTRQGVEGQIPPLKSDIEQIGYTEEVRQLLISMVSKYKGYTPESGGDFTTLLGAITVLGDFAEKQAQPLLAKIVSNNKYYRIARAAAVRSLGKIDPDGNKNVLLSALEDKSNYLLIRTEAAAALANTQDATVLKSLDKNSREEKDSHVRKQFADAAEKLRAKIQSKR